MLNCSTMHELFATTTDGSYGSTQSRLAPHDRAGAHTMTEHGERNILNNRRDLPPVGSTFDHLSTPSSVGSSLSAYRYTYRVTKHRLGFALWPGLNESFPPPSKEELRRVPLQWRAEIEVVNVTRIPVVRVDYDVVDCGQDMRRRFVYGEPTP